MERPERQFIREGSDELDILSAVWIVACNDENSIMLYEDLRFRLGLPTDYDLKKLVLGRGEMFRRGVPSSRLEAWKKRVIGKKNFPSWVLAMDSEKTQIDAIGALEPDDAFRSQWRTRKNADRSSIEVIEWGVRHIDRLRKARLEVHEQTAKRWEVWLVAAVSVINIAVTVILALTQSGCT